MCIAECKCEEFNSFVWSFCFISCAKKKKRNILPTVCVCIPSSMREYLAVYISKSNQILRTQTTSGKVIFNNWQRHYQLYKTIFFFFLHFFLLLNRMESHRSVTDFPMSHMEEIEKKFKRIIGNGKCVM